MYRVFVLYEVAPDATRYAEHAELCRRVEGATFRHCPITGSGSGKEPPFGYYAEWEFPDRDAFRAAASTPEFAATGPDAMAMGIPFQVYFAEIE